MRILVTGAMGFIGSNLVPRLLNAGHAVMGFDNFSNESIGAAERIKKASGDNWGKFILHPGDICNPSALMTALTIGKIDAVVHLAARGSVPRSFKTPSECVRINEYGFANLCEVMNQAGVKKLIFASSSSVYGDAQGVYRVEGNEGRPQSPYAVSKRQNEDFARAYCGANGIAYVGLRFFNVYGPGQRFDSDFSAVIPKFIHNARPLINGDGLTIRDFTFVGDVARAIECALEFTETKHEGVICNVGAGLGTSLITLCNLLGKEPEFGPARAGDVAFSIANTAYAEKAIGFTALTTVARGLQITKAFYERLENGKESAEKTL